MPNNTGPMDEQVALALQNAPLSDGEGNSYRLFDLLDFSGENKAVTITRQLARAAIEAMSASVIDRPMDEQVERLQVTDAMIEAGWAKLMLVPGYPQETKRTLADAYLAMHSASVIDEGLRERLLNAVIQAAKPSEREPLSISYAQLERGIRAALSAMPEASDLEREHEALKDDFDRRADLANEYLNENIALERKCAAAERALLNKIKADAYCDETVCAFPNGPNCHCQAEFEHAIARELSL